MQRGRSVDPRETDPPTPRVSQKALSSEGISTWALTSLSVVGGHLGPTSDHQVTTALKIKQSVILPEKWVYLGMAI